MSAQSNRAIVEQYFEVIQGRNQGVELAACFSDDVFWHVPPSNPDIRPNPRVGKAAVMDLLTSGVGVYEAGSMAIDLQRLVADDDHVVAQFTMRARLANGAPYENHYCFVFALRDGVICGVWEYLDTLAQSEQGTWSQ